MRSETTFEMGKKKIKKSKPGEDSKYDFNLKSLGRGNIFRVKWFWFSSCRNLNRKRTWCERHGNRDEKPHILSVITKIWIIFTDEEEK